MLKSHMDAVEKSLVQISQVPSNAGHTLHRGTPREAFVRQFLEGHLSASVAIGTGEVIDAGSRPREKRNQFDVVIYRANYPRLDFGGGAYGFLIESVVATIEVKSLLNRKGVEDSVLAAHAVKQLVPHVNVALRSGWIPPKVVSYVVAYRGPARMATVHSWIAATHAKHDIPMPSWSQEGRLAVPGTALDGVVVLNKGFVKLDNTPLTLNNLANPAPCTHVICDSQDGNLLALFLALQEVSNNLEAVWLDAMPYLKSASFPVRFI